MYRVKRYALVVVVVAAIVAIAIAGCSSGGKAVAEINGKKITNAEFAKFVGRTPAGSQLLAQMMEDVFWVQMAEEKGVPPTDKQIDQMLGVIRKVTDLDKELKKSGLTIDALKEQLKIQQAQVNLAEQAMKGKVSDDDVKSAYEAMKAQRFDVPERVKTEVVLFPSKEAAEKASGELKKGADLEKVAREAGTNVTTWPIPKNGPGMPVELVSAAFDTPMGKTSDPIELKSLGAGKSQWVIVRPGERVPPVRVSFDQAKPMVRAQVVMMKASQDSDYQKKIEEARKKAKIKILEPSMKQAEKNFREPMSLGQMGMGGGRP